MSKPIVMKPINFTPLQLPFYANSIKLDQNLIPPAYVYPTFIPQQPTFVEAYPTMGMPQQQVYQPQLQKKVMIAPEAQLQLPGGTAKRKRSISEANDKQGRQTEIPAKRANTSRTVHTPQRAKQAGWSAEEDAILKQGIAKYSYKLGEPDYESIIAKLPNRTIKQAKERWKNCLDPGIVKGEWSVKELCHLLDMIQKFDQQWTTIQKCMKSRSMHCIKSKGRKILGESLSKKLRRITKSPCLKKPWSNEECALLENLHKKFRYDIDTISMKMALSGFCRPEAQIERKILQLCNCTSCQAECERYMKVDGNFKRAWTVAKAKELKQKLLDHGKLS